MTQNSLFKTTSPATASLLKIDDDSLVRSASIAYEDGYADAREYGKDGFFVSGGYNAYAREQYAMGFKRGLRVHNLMGR